MTKNKQLTVAALLSAVTMLTVTATAAFAMPVGEKVARPTARPAAQSASPVIAAQPAAPVVVWQPATQTVDAAPAQVEDRSGAVETEKPEAEKVEAAHPEIESSRVSDQVAVSQPEQTVIHMQPVEHGTEVEFKGTIESLTGVSPTLTLSVSGRVVTTTAQTLFIDPISVGDFVEVDGYVQPDHSVQAKKIKLDDDALLELEVEFRGSIVVLPADPDWLGSWVVGQYTLTVDANTTIDTRRGQPAVGAIAEVKAERQPDNSLLAVRVKIEDDGEFENEAEFKGIVSNLTGSGPYSLTVAGHSVTTNAATLISGTLANGLLVEVHGTRQADGSVLATRIEIEDPLVDELEFTAAITALPANFIGQWTFANGQTVTADANTLIDQSRGAAQVGALAEVKAMKQLDGSWLAVRIQVEDN